MSKKKIKENKPDIYGELANFQDKLHAQNLKRIHIGLLCVLIIPMIFLALMFITDSNKVIWLILWIVSLFAISAYLIVVEYGDYNLQHRINSITGNEAEPVPLLESGINGMNGKIASVKAEARDILASAKDSLSIDEDKPASNAVAASDIYSSEIDTDIIKKSLASDSSLENDASTEASVSKDKKKKSSGKKDKKKKDKDKDKKHKKDKDKKDKKDGKGIKKKNKSGNKSDNAKDDDSGSIFMDESVLENNHSKKSEKNKAKKKDKKKKDKKNTSKSVPKSGAYSEYSAADSNNDDNELSAPKRVSLEKPFSENSLFADDSLKSNTVGNSASMDSADTGNNTESRFAGYKLVKEDEFDE